MIKAFRLLPKGFFLEFIMRELPDWIIDGIDDPDVKERALTGKLTSNEKFDVYCYKCKKVLSICLRSKLSIKRIEDKEL